jgi:WD40 repeat protein/predicted Ser/Thr protein kinase
MSEPSPETVEALFQQAIDLDPHLRGAFLDERCAGDPDLRAAVEELLQFDVKAQNSPDFLHSPAADVRASLAATAQAEAVPASIGRYRIVRRLGEGGMGTVYEAEQDDPRRTVALKVMRPGFDSPELRKRFAQEARILGRLHHAGIAQVYDAGATADGRLYFAMEFIRGLPLGQHVRLRGLTAPARLELMARVCDAVQHAHDQGVIHRDLKPANILADETGQPKVLDFGVAQATGAGLLGTTAHTRTGQLIGTLDYMSPEQVAGDSRAIDARSDVYALGVILYELLADRLPYRLGGLPIPEVARVIWEVEPSRLGSVNPQFRGEIETIVAKALEKDKTRRYPSAGALGEDLRHYLAHEPIRARPASALYKIRKFVNRHRGLVAGAAAVFAAMLAATIISLVSAHDARRSARLARSREYQARLAAAIAALSGNDVADAARHLKRAPEELHGWEWRHLRSRLDDSTAVVRLRTGDPALLLSGPEGLRAGIFTETGLRFTDENGNESPELPVPRIANGVFCLAQAAERWGLAASEGPTHLTLRDETGGVLRRIVPNGGSIVGVALSPDRTRVAVALWRDTADTSIGIYDTSSGEERARCGGEIGWCALAFSPDGKRLASGGDGPVVHLWDPATGRQLAECKGHTSKILAVAFRADGSRLLTASHDGTVRQWDARTGQEVEQPYDHHAGPVSAAVYSPDGERVASAGADHTIRLWRASDRQDQALLRGHSGVVVGLAFSRDGRRLVSASYSRPTSLGDGTVRFWEAAPEVTLPVLAGHTSYVYQVAYSPDSRWIASGGWDKKVRLWDATTGELGTTLPHPGVVWALAFSPDGTWLVSGGTFEGGPLLWDVATGQRRGRVPGSSKSVRSLAVSPDGARVAVGSYNLTAGMTMAVLDIATGQEVGAGEGLPYAFSPDGQWLAASDAGEKDIVLWDARGFRPAARWQGHTDRINAIAFSRDGGRLISASRDRTVRLWDVPTGQCLRVFEGHTDEVFAAAFQPNGTRIASAGRDRAIWLWDPVSGQDVARLPGHTDYVRSLAYSPGGETLISGSGDFTVRFWDTAPLAKRYEGRREAEALRSEAERLVERLFQEKKDAAEVVAVVRADRSLSEPQRHAALRAVLQAEMRQRQQESQ